MNVELEIDELSLLVASINHRLAWLTLTKGEMPGIDGFDEEIEVCKELQARLIEAADKLEYEKHI